MNHDSASVKKYKSIKLSRDILGLSCDNILTLFKKFCSKNFLNIYALARMQNAVHKSNHNILGGYMAAKVNITQPLTTYLSNR